MTENENIKKGLPSVALISDERFPFHGTNTQQVIKNVSSLTEAGLPVELIIPVQSRGFFKRGYKVTEEICNYYNVPQSLKVKTIFTIPAGRTRLEKFTHAVAAPIYTLFKKTEIIYTRNEYTTLVAALLGQNVIFETYRLLGDEYPRLMKMASKLARRKNFLGMILHSKLSADSMARAGIPEEKLLPCHNGFDPSDVIPRLSKDEARVKTGLPRNKKLVVYTGNMQKNKSIESVIDIAALTEEAHFVLVGGRPEDIQRLSDYAASLNVTNVAFTGHKPITDVSMYLYAADILLIPTVSAPLQNYGRTVLPFKTFLYVAIGRPIVAPDLPDVGEILNNRENALLVEPDSPDKSSEAIKDILNSPTLAETISENSLKTADSLTWESRAARIIGWIQKIYE